MVLSNGAIRTVNSLLKKVDIILRILGNWLRVRYTAFSLLTVYELENRFLKLYVAERKKIDYVSKS